ncbi:MAG: TlpA family protein disulfide reductase [Prevotella sp.]|nr:TlpA family protein disulfide reductase [Prevotella sp.]
MKRLMTLTAIALIALGAMAQPQQRELSAADKIAEDLQNAFFAGMGDVMEKLQELNDAFYRSGNRDSVQRLMEPYQKIYMERQKAYLEKYPTTALAANMMRMELGNMPLEKMKEVYNKFDATAKETTAGKAMAKEIATLEQVAPGNPAPEIAKNDFVTGKPFSLSSLKGKVVLLDFWASWCVPCRKSNPHVKALYEKYKKKGFDVVYVADNDDRPDQALKAIDEDGIKKYHHVLRGLKTRKGPNGERLGYDDSEDVSKLYAVHYLPTKYLIDRDGNIVGQVDDETLDAKLKELFGF